MESSRRNRAAFAARLRGARPGAFQRAPRTIYADGRGRQHADLPAFHGCAVLPHVAPAGAQAMAKAADRADPEEHAAPSRRHLKYRLVYSAPLSASGT